VSERAGSSGGRKEGVKRGQIAWGDRGQERVDRAGR
jgi:hypothetical protein